ncbi:hypothetical protein N9F48_04210 [Akkermansiaceae bacterium]|nr:hypothetical protein [Akkermansiaceae bacterium]
MNLCSWLDRYPAILVLTAFCLYAQQQAHGGIEATTGDVEIVASPTNVRRNVYESSSFARVFPERFIASTASVTINAVEAGRYDAYSDFQDVTIDNPPPFETYFLHFDPVSMNQAAVSGTITFESPILGVIGRSLTMQQTDGSLGAVGTLYPTNRYDREPYFSGNYDYFEISEDRLTVSFRLRATEIDQFRIVATLPTGVTPSRKITIGGTEFFEGTGFAIMLSGVFGTTFTIHAASDLTLDPVFWPEIGNGIIGSGPTPFLDSNAISSSRRFYVVSWQTVE